MEANQIPIIMQRLDKIVAEDRIRKYSTALIVKIIVILKIYGYHTGHLNTSSTAPENSWNY